MCEPYTGVGLFWCNRCGTLKANVVTEEDDVPKLVSRITEFAGKLTGEHQDLIDEFERLGIQESIIIFIMRHYEKLQRTGEYNHDQWPDSRGDRLL